MKQEVTEQEVWTVEHHCYPPPIAVQLPGREKQSPHKCGKKLTWCAWRGVMSQRLMQLSMLRSMCGPCTRSATWKCGRGGGWAQHVWAVHTVCHLELGREGGGGKAAHKCGPHSTW